MTTNESESKSDSTISADKERTTTFSIEFSVYERFVEFTRANSKTEWGGILLGKFDNGHFHASVAILPPQHVQNPVYCEFKKEFFLANSRMLGQLEEQGFSYDEIPQFGCWIHTHPGLTAFLSGTDVETFTYLTKMNPRLTAVVIDPLKIKNKIKINDKNKDKHYVCVNSQPGPDYNFTKIPFSVKNIPDVKNQVKLYETLYNEVNEPYFLNIMKSEKPMHVFTPIDDYECISEVMTSKFQDLEQKIKYSDERTILSADFQIDTTELKKHLGIDLNNSSIITNYKLTSEGIVIHDLLHPINPRIEFIPWKKIRKVSLLFQQEAFIFLELKISIFLRSRMERYLFLSQTPTKFLNVIARYVGSIVKSSFPEVPRSKTIVQEINGDLDAVESQDNDDQHSNSEPDKITESIPESESEQKP